jgi:hypothetical protein
MSVLNRVAYFQGRRDELPNQDLARDLAESKDAAAIREIAAAIWHPDRNIQSDCLKVLYEIGYLDAELIADYAEDFLKLLHHKNNRMVWGGMIALSTIATLKADLLFQHRLEVQEIMGEGSVITIDSGVKILALMAAQKDEYRQVLFPYLLHHLETCRSSDIPRHAELIAPVVNKGQDADSTTSFRAVLEKRLRLLTAPQAARVNKILKQIA